MGMLSPHVRPHGPGLDGGHDRLPVGGHWSRPSTEGALPVVRVPDLRVRRGIRVTPPRAADLPRQAGSAPLMRRVMREGVRAVQGPKGEEGEPSGAAPACHEPAGRVLGGGRRCRSPGTRPAEAACMA